jgi:hypothetical protein
MSLSKNRTQHDISYNLIPICTYMPVHGFLQL